MNMMLDPDSILVIPEAYNKPGKIIRVLAYRGDKLVGQYPANPRTRQRLSPKRIKGIKHYFRYHHGKFTQEKREGKWVSQEIKPYIRFVYERVFA